MKNWLLIAVCASVAMSPLAWGILPPAQPPLPNYDKRPSLSVTPTEAEARERALARLRERLPDVTVDRDRVLGTAAFITTPRSFLTPPAGVREIVAAGVSTSPANDPYRVIKAFIDDHVDLFGHTSGVLASARVSRDYVTAHNGLHTVIWEQIVDDVP